MGKFFVGLIIGVLIAGGLAYYLNSRTLNITSRVQPDSGSGFVANGSAPITLSPGTKFQEQSSGVKANASGGGFDFYSILPGKSNASSVSANAANSSGGGNSNQQQGQFIVQAGSFSDSNAANAMKAQLALQGIEARIEVARQGSNVFNRVVIGPFNNLSDAQNQVSSLGQLHITAKVLKVSQPQ
jgi:hypothetical protein